MNHRDTLSVCMGVFEGFEPHISPEAAEADYLLLANIDPYLQLHVLESVQKPSLIAFDTMNLWIETQRDNVEYLIAQSDLAVLNDAELFQLTGEPSLLKGADKVLKMGPKYVVAKKGEHGAVLISEDNPPFLCPAYPLLEPRDPTGAGDCFIGAMIGYLAATGELSPFNLRRAVVYGTITASFAVEDFGLGRLQTITAEDVESRLRDYRNMVEF
jgi:sugar/nucleoside kinase (ribokinase family)